MNVKNVILYVLVLFCVTSYAGSEIVFIAFEITTPEKISEYDKLYKKTGGLFSHEEYNSMMKLVDIKYQDNILIESSNICIDKKYPVQYAKKDGDLYVLVPSDMMQGVKCKFDLEVIPSVGFMLHGEAEYYVPSKRALFSPYPDVNVGLPISLMGGYFRSGLLFPGDKYAVNCCSMKSIKDGNVTRATGLIVLIQGDIRSQVPPDSVVVPSEIRE